MLASNNFQFSTTHTKFTKYISSHTFLNKNRLHTLILARAQKPVQKVQIHRKYKEHNKSNKCINNVSMSKQQAYNPKYKIDYKSFQNKSQLYKLREIVSICHSLSSPAYSMRVMFLRFVSPPATFNCINYH